jgi:hypothetical protein
MNMEQLVEWELAGEIVVPGKTYIISILSTKNPTWADLGSNPGRRWFRCICKLCLITASKNTAILTSFNYRTFIAIFPDTPLLQNILILQCSKAADCPRVAQEMTRPSVAATLNSSLIWKMVLELSLSSIRWVLWLWFDITRKHFGLHWTISVEFLNITSTYWLEILVD